jgi:rubrerythrin
MSKDEFTIKDALELAVIAEQTGAKIYARMARKAEDDPELAEVFLRLTREEEAHEALFRELLAALSDEEKAETGRYGVQEFLKATAISEFFGGETRERFRSISSIQEALEGALKLERDTLAFYLELRTAIGGSPILDEIIEIERTHVSDLVGALNLHTGAGGKR